MIQELPAAGSSRLATFFRKTRGFCLGSILVTGLAAAAFFTPTAPEALTHPDRALSLQLVDRNGELLRDVLSTQAGVAHWRALADISPYLVSATIVSEDRRFYHHPGVDPLAIGRAFRADFHEGKIVQGGSTITQQLVRNLVPQDRNWKGKVNEAYWALRLERMFSKDQILESYLNRVAYGSQCYGVEAASQFYFAKNAGQLSCAQAAFLALLPRAPESFLPYQELEEMLPLQKQLLHRMREAGRISQEELDLALAEKLSLHPAKGYFEAGHFCDFVQASQKQTSGILRTTLDAGLNREIEAILRTQIRRIHSNAVNNGAVVVLDVFSGDIVAMVGSTDYEESQFNAATAGRQPGSALKPFTYALALERDKSAASVLPDLNLYPRQIANGYIPRNYDDKFHGPVRLRTALACSYNVPVVRVLEEIGTESLLSLLRNLGFSRLTDTPQHYGLGLTLGDGEVTLLEIANAYRTLARGGRLRPVRYLAEQQVDAERPVIDPRAAWIITDILKDRLERVPAFGSSTPLNLPFPVAAKTGTSKSYRDNWTVGYTPRYVVAVWVGNLDGSSMKGVSGITGAGPIFHEVFLAVERRLGSSQPFTAPVGVEQVAVCPASGELAGKDCPGTIVEWFRSDKKPTATCSVHQRVGHRVFTVYPPLYRNWMAEKGMPFPSQTAHSNRSDARVSIAFPDSNSIFRRDPVVRADRQEIHFRGVVPDDTATAEWIIDGVPTKVERSPFALWWRLQPGGHQAVLVARDALQHELGRSHAISFIVR